MPTSSDQTFTPDVPLVTEGAEVSGAAPEPEAPQQAAAAAGVNLGEIERIVAGTHHDPHSILGAHPGADGFVIRTLRPFAASVAVVLADGRRFPMEHVHLGVFAAVLPYDGAPGGPPAYRIAVAYPEADGSTGPEFIVDDPFRHLPTLGEFDLHLIGEGRHEELWQVLGSNVRDLGSDGLGDITGTSFAVWAPNARGVRVIGDFNHWNGQGHPMRSLGGSGIWELFIPDVTENTRYKYDICGPDGTWRAKADPMARGTERPPATASVVVADHHEWRDEGRGNRGPHRGRGGGRPPPRSGGRRPGCRRGPTGGGGGSRSASTRCTSGPGGRACPTASW